MKEQNPLQWPAGWPRTRIQDRESRKGWKKTERQSIDALEAELRKFGALSSVITRKAPHDPIGAPDPSVAVYFARKSEDDFSWQDALQIHNPAPTKEEIDASFRKLSAKHHPDNIDRGSGGDVEVFHALSAHRKKAIAYVNRLSGNHHDFVIACDKFTETRWNVNAIRMTIHSLRQMERDGTSRLLERALEGFRELNAAPEHAAQSA